MLEVCSSGNQHRRGFAPPSNAVQYWFEDYLNVQHNMQFGFIQPSPRSQPNLSGVASQRISKRVLTNCFCLLKE